MLPSSVLYVPSYAHSVHFFLICPEGYFAPSALESSFFRVLSSDRIAPVIYTSANAHFDAIKSANRSTVLRTASKLFTHSFVSSIENDAQVFCPTIQNPLHVGSWLLRTTNEAPSHLPENLDQSNQTLKSLESSFAFLCPYTWSIDKEGSAFNSVELHRNEATLLYKIDGWSVCFRSDLLPADYGQALETIAKALALKNSAQKRTAKKRGRRSKVEPLIKELEKMYPSGSTNKTVNEIERDLRSRGIIDFKETTLNSAVSSFKNTSITVG